MTYLNTTKGNLCIKTPVGFLVRLMENSHKQSEKKYQHYGGFAAFLLEGNHLSHCVIILVHVRAAHPLVQVLAPQNRQFGKRSSSAFGLAIWRVSHAISQAI